MNAFGIDVVRINRLENWRDDNFRLNHIFTATELADAEAKKDFIAQLASIFAAKEAFMKAIGTGWSCGVDWKDIEVISTKTGVGLNLYNVAKRICGSRKIYVSLSFAGSYAVAMVALES